MTEKGVAAVDRALSIVNALGKIGKPSTLSEIAAATGLYKSTALRLIASLDRSGFVTRDGDARYRLGPAIYQLAGHDAYTAAFEDHIAPALRHIVEETGEGAAFYVRVGNERLCLLRVDSPHPVRHHVNVGERRPLDIGASGRVLKLFEKGATQASPRDLAALPFVVLGEGVPDLAAIAIPVFGSAGRILGAISVSGPLSRFDQRMVGKVKRVLRETTIELTSQLGGDPALFRWRR